MKVKIGQIWRDNDKRHQNPLRDIEIVSLGREFALGRNTKTRRHTSIRLDRFRKNSTGYVLIGHMPVSSRCIEGQGRVLQTARKERGIKLATRVVQNGVRVWRIK